MTPSPLERMGNATMSYPTLEALLDFARATPPGIPHDNQKRSMRNDTYLLFGDNSGPIGLSEPALLHNDDLEKL